MAARIIGVIVVLVVAGLLGGPLIGFGVTVLEDREIEASLTMQVDFDATEEQSLQDGWTLQVDDTGGDPTVNLLDPEDQTEDSVAWTAPGDEGETAVLEGDFNVTVTFTEHNDTENYNVIGAEWEDQDLEGLWSAVPTFLIVAFIISLIGLLVMVR